MAIAIDYRHLLGDSLFIFYCIKFLQKLMFIIFYNVCNQEFRMSLFKWSRECPLEFEGLEAT